MNKLSLDLEIIGTILDDTFSKLEKVFSKIPDERKKKLADTVKETIELYSKNPDTGRTVLLDSNTHGAIYLLSLMNEPYKSLGEKYLKIYQDAKNEVKLGI